MFKSFDDFIFTLVSLQKLLRLLQENELSLSLGYPSNAVNSPTHWAPFPVYPDGQGPHLYPLALAGGGRSTALNSCITRLTITFTGINVTVTETFLCIPPDMHNPCIQTCCQCWFCHLLRATHTCPPWSQAHMLIVGLQVALAPLSSVTTNDRLNYN